MYSGVTVATAVAIEGLTTSQLKRRERVISAALELAAEGGYEAVQMRDVSAKAKVALGTIYRYFSSKDHLLAAALVEWAADLEEMLIESPPVGESTAERVSQILRTATLMMEENPLLSSAVVAALSTNDPRVVECQYELDKTMGRINARVFPADFDPALRARITRALGHVYLSSLIGWVNGWFCLSVAADELESAAHLMLDQFD